MDTIPARFLAIVLGAMPAGSSFGQGRRPPVEPQIRAMLRALTGVGVAGVAIGGTFGILVGTHGLG